MSLRIDVSHEYHPISALTAHVGNAHRQLQNGAAYWGEQITAIIGPNTAVIASGKV